MKKSCTIYLVRHGETDWNLKNIIQGHSDIVLNKNGEKQAEELVKLFEHIDIDAIFSSDLKRAMQTAEKIAKKRGIDIQTSKALRERNFGDYEGKPFKEVGKVVYKLIESYRKIVKIEDKKGAIESDQAIIKRLLPYLKKISKQYLGKTILIVCHGGAMRCLLLHFGLINYKSLGSGSIMNLGCLKFQTDGENFKLIESSRITYNLTS